MLFNVEEDSGNLIVGYLVPDSFSGRAILAVRHRGEEVLRLEPTQVRDALVAAGRHETGMCGFRIDESSIPGLSEMADLDILNVEAGIIIYRRLMPDRMVPKKMFRLETSFMPLWKIDVALRNRFQFYFPKVDRFGIETVHQMMLMNNTSSVYMSGRLTYKSIEFYVEQGYECIVVVADPFEELAERILVLKTIAGRPSEFFGDRDQLQLEPAIQFASALPLESDRELKRAFRDVDSTVVDTLRDPLTRQLTTKLPNEQVTRGSTATALNVLSTFKIVGLRSRMDLFTESLTDHLSLLPGELPGLPSVASVTGLAERLRSCPQVEPLLEFDLALHHYVSDALEKSLTSS